METTEQEIEELKRQIAIRDKTIEVQALQLAAKEKQLAHCREQGQRMREYLAWERDLFGNPGISATDKLAFRAARGEYEQAGEKNPEPEPAEPDAEPTPRPIYIEDIAKRCGFSRSTAGDAIKRLRAAGALTVKHKHEVSDYTGTPILRVSLAPTLAALNEPARLAPVEPRNHGGRRLCPHCGGMHKWQVTTITTCEGCGAEIDRTVRETNKEDGTEEPEPLETIAASQSETQETRRVSQVDSPPEQLPVSIADFCQQSPTRHHEYALLRDVDKRRLCIHCDRAEQVWRPLQVEVGVSA